MKRLKYLLASVLLFLTAFLPVLPVSAETNLIANESVETANASSPANWTANSWGTNTATPTYESNGHTGNKSLRFQVSGHTDGDAKWMHDAVSVSPNTSYTYTSFYKSSVDTELDLQYTDTTGNVSYAYAQYVPASADWAPITTTFTTPANVASVTVMHIIATNGWVQTDDFSLTTTVVPPAPTGDNLIANPSFATANGNAPAGWLTNSWGTNSSSFSYETTGRTDSRSAKVTVSTHTDGDAKWYANPVDVTAGKTYVYSDYYKSNVSTRVVAAFLDGSGNFSYAELAGAQASTDWAQYETTFVVPATAVKVTVFHVIDSVGNLTLDDVSLTEEEHSHEDGENMLHNPSVEESGNGVTPTHWQNNKWGNNSATFTYENTGRTGTRSVKVNMTAHADGDAKWFAEPEAVTAGKTYLYRDYFKATVATRVVVAFIDASGNYSYQELAGVGAASDWTLYEATFTAPTGAVQASVYHLIDQVGSLTIDDALLQVSNPVATVTIPNPSLENGNATPNNWQNNKWGTNTASFQYVTNEGHTGNRSAKVTMTSHVDGDAKWFFNPVSTLTPGSQYRFTAWYKGTAVPKVTAMYVMSDGTEHYVGLPSPQTISETTWTKYTDTFTVPEGTTQTSIFLMLDSNGWLQTDDYSINAYSPNGFTRGLVTLTFDDGHEDNTETALPIMEQYGFKSTQCYATSFIEGMSQDVIDGVMEFYNSGHEICSHTVTHPFLTTLNGTDLNYELQHSQQYLESLIGQPVRNFATPYGDYNANVNDVIDNYYQSHRTVDEGFNSKDNFDVYRLRVQNVLDTTSAAQVQEWIDQAVADKTWLILVYHRVASDPGPYDAFTNVFAEQMQVLANSGATVKTWQAALDEVLPQL